MQVLQWMVDARIRPSSQMYLDISSFAQKSGGAEYATLIKERVGMQMHISFNRIPLFRNLCFACTSQNTWRCLVLVVGWVASL